MTGGFLPDTAGSNRTVERNRPTTSPGTNKSTNGRTSERSRAKGSLANFKTYDANADTSLIAGAAGY